MSSQDGRRMDRSPPSGSVRRARERAMAGMARDDDVVVPPTMPGGMNEEPQIARPSLSRQMPMAPSGASRILRPPPPPGLQTRDGQIGVAISRPTPIPQWPLQVPLGAPSGPNGTSYQPPPGRSQPPQRPPRPSRVPSILDSSKVQDITPSFQYRPQSERDSSGQELMSIPETDSSLSRPSTLSSVGTIPDFPLPAQIPLGPPRRSVNLGPPPSARRGASSFYSNASYVSPIPEESPRSRSHTSFASSAAMPESWGTASPGQSPNYPDFYDDTIAEEGGSVEDDDAEESRLVRSASIGKRAKPTLVTAATSRGADGGSSGQRPGPTPVQNEPFRDGTGYIDNSSSSSTIPQVPRAPPAATLAVGTMLESSTDQSSTEGPAPSPQPGLSRPYSRLSAIRRPPRLDMDAVARAESRGSLTSLTDLIRRATRLAASLEKGRRPASRFDDFDYDGDDRAMSFDGEKHQSGLSDMLAAFPPPAQAGPGPQRRSWRDSIRQQIQSWPLPIGTSRTPNTSNEANAGSTDSPSPDRGKRGRRCCGLPLWGFLVVLTVVGLVIAAAVAIPVEFFVVRRQRAGDEAQAALQQCASQLTCANGGTNVINQGFCSCICSNGFTGFDCTLSDSTGCTSIALTGNTNINNVTVGDAIPRLLRQSERNFSIPLSSTEILAKLNAGNLSCSAMNALVTFNGGATRDVVVPVGALGAAVGVVFTTITILAGQFTTIILGGASATPATTTARAVATPALGSAGGDNDRSTIFLTSISFATTITFGGRPSSTSTVTTTMPMGTGTAIAPAPSATFIVDGQVLDFARVAVLYILQEESLNDAKNGQSILQRFFNSASAAGGGVSVEMARNVTLGNGNSIDLVDFFVDTRSKEKIGAKPAVKARWNPPTALPFPHLRRR